MKRLFSIFQPKLDESIRTRVDGWRHLPDQSLDNPLEKQSLVVVDVETSGLDIRRDSLLSIGAVRMEGLSISMGRVFHRFLRQEKGGSKENVLVHGITHEQQAAGDPEPEVLLDFLEFAGKSPLVAFHAPFDQTFLKRYMKTHLGLGFNNPFLDLAWLMPALVPVENSKLVGLDEWLKKFGISVNVRHSAEEDAMVTAELLLIALARARQQGRNNLNELIELARSRQLDHSQGGRG